jgi:excisionase family DNA binding protein
MAQGLGQGQGGGTAGTAAEVAMGFSMAQQMMNQPGGMFGQQSTPPAAPAAAASAGSPATELMSPADAAKILGVSESDVMAALTDGSLKGKKIGSAYRITRQALDEFLKS